VLFNRPRITGRLRRPRSVLANLVFEFAWHARISKALVVLRLPMP
jgi:hypothetical protein